MALPAGWTSFVINGAASWGCQCLAPNISLIDAVYKDGMLLKG